MSSTQRWLNHKGEVSQKKTKRGRGSRLTACIRRTKEGRVLKGKTKNSLINRNGSRTDAKREGNFSCCGMKQRGRRE